MDYEDIYKRLAREIIKHEGIIEGSASAFVSHLAAKLKKSGLVIDDLVKAELEDYLASMQESINAGIISAATLAAATMPEIQQSALVARLAEEAFTERWPDGLRLSDRLWNWQDDVRTGLTRVVRDGIKAGEAVDRIAMTMQRTIERTHGGQRFKIVEKYADDWVKELHEAAVDLIHNPGDRAYWNKVVGEAEDRILELKATGSRNAAERVLDQMKKAVLKGSEELADNSVKWWLYDKQMYHLKRIARTEMATALHKSVIASAENDETIIGFQWRLSASHPVTDICDYYANIEMGLGKGVFTKEAVPRNKAHPHCMCLLFPRATPINQKGTRDFVAFINSLPDDVRFEALPKWMQNLNRLGMPLERLVKDSGLLTRAALRAQMGEDRFNAVSAIAHAANNKQFAIKDLTKHKSKTAKMLADLETLRDNPEVDAFVRQVHDDPKHVDSRLQHYIKRRYQDNTWEGSLPDMDALFRRIVTDPASTIHRNNARYQIRSTANKWIGIIEPTGTRVSLFPEQDDDLGASLWKLKSLLD